MNLKYTPTFLLIFSHFILTSTNEQKHVKKHSDQKLSRIYKKTITITQEFETDSQPTITSVDTLNDQQKLIPTENSVLKKKRKPYGSFKKNTLHEPEHDPVCFSILTWLLDCVCC